MSGLRTSDLLTLHAAIRTKQRAIPTEQIDLIVRFGEEYDAGCGHIAYFVGRRTVKPFLGRGIRIDSVCNKAVVESGDGAVVTVMHASRPCRSWKN